jgi:hypothetical protein
LGRQRVETLQVMRAITRAGHGWRHHPVVRMWREYPEALARYGLSITAEWIRRGHADTCAGKIVAELDAVGVEGPPRTQTELAAAGALPPWLGDEAFHRSHRSSLLRKDPAFYGSQFDEPTDLPYVWPEGAAAAS